MSTPCQARAEDIAARCQRAGFAASIAEDVRVTPWTKLVGSAANAALTSASRVAAALLSGDPGVLAVLEALIAGTAAVARAAGVALPAETGAKAPVLMRGFPAGLYASMAHDLMRGNALELDGLSGHVAREGRPLGVPTPHHAALHAVLKLSRNGPLRLP